VKWPRSSAVVYSTPPSRERERERGLTIVSPIPRLKIPAKGARGRSLYPEDIQIGRAHPSKSEKWLSKRKFCHEKELNEAVYHKHCAS